MVERIQAIRGMNDILPEQTAAWQYLEHTFSQCLQAYGYQEIRFPILENTALFKRTIGDATDIVEKEMYTFQDLNGDSLSLRPEGTAGCVRAALQNGLLHNQQQKFWYCGPMFRHERPQKGRYRQFHQIGVEVFGIPGIGIELELMALCYRIWGALGFQHAVQLHINTIGDLQERQIYRDQLVSYFNDHFDELDEDSKRRLTKNPLRILDSKNPAMADLIQHAPKLIDSISEESRKRFSSLCEGLDALNIAYVINPFLVRGLDYYGHTVFEWVANGLGSQATICGGGRFDGLVEQLGGNPSSAVGFALGIERLLLLMETLNISIPTHTAPDIFIMAMGEKALQHALVLAESLRSAIPCIIYVNTAESGLKSQFKKADKSGASLALLLGEDEVAQKQISIKMLRDKQDQVTIPEAELLSYIKNYFRIA